MIRVAGVLHNTTVNGPGVRTAVWTQGCSLACPGCYNPRTWDPCGGQERDPAELAQELVANAAEHTEGITLSGGEPLQQQQGVLSLIREVKALRPEWSVFMFTGHTPGELDNLSDFDTELMDQIDVLVAGRFVRKLRIHARWRSSSNQRVLFLTDRYAHLEHQVNQPFGLEMELHINEDGSVVKTGYAGKNFCL